MLYGNADKGMGCSAVTGSMTSAMKAQRLLNKHALHSNVKKISPMTQNKGCIYGIEFDCALMGNVKSILDSADIKVIEFLK